MDKKIKLSRGERKFIRRAKARIRRETADKEEQARRIKDLMKTFE